VDGFYRNRPTVERGNFGSYRKYDFRSPTPIDHQIGGVRLNPRYRVLSIARSQEKNGGSPLATKRKAQGGTPEPKGGRVAQTAPQSLSRGFRWALPTLLQHNPPGLPFIQLDTFLIRMDTAFLFRDVHRILP